MGQVWRATLGLWLLCLAGPSLASTSLEALEADLQAKRTLYEQKLAELKQAKDDLRAAEQALIEARPPERKNGAGNRDAPTTDVFNNQRLWNPDKILWNGRFWECTGYDELTGECRGVKIIDGSSKP